MMDQYFSLDDLLGIIESELENCTAEQRSLFEQHRVSPYKVPIHRFGNLEEAFIVAELPDGLLVYYEEVEEGFDIVRLGADGAIAKPSCNQFELTHLLEQLKQ